MNTLIQRGVIKLIKSDSKGIYISNVIFKLFWTSKNPEKLYRGFNKNIKQFST